jgi:hypothetical protein
MGSAAEMKSFRAIAPVDRPSFSRSVIYLPLPAAQNHFCAAGGGKSLTGNIFEKTVQ